MFTFTCGHHGIPIFSFPVGRRHFRFDVGLRFPSNEFLIMGSGASKQKYAPLKEMGVHSMTDVNERFGTDWDGGQLAYCLCMCKM